MTFNKILSNAVTEIDAIINDGLTITNDGNSKNNEHKGKRHFILIRGHQGSGKSTFAKAVQNFLFDKYQLSSVLLERDQYFMNNGTYEWSADKFQDADNWLNDAIKSAFIGTLNPSDTKTECLGFSDGEKADVVILTGTNTKKSHIHHYMSLVNQYNKKVKEYNRISFNTFRMQNFFENTHSVPLEKVIEVINATEDYDLDFLVNASVTKENKLDLLNEVKESNSREVNFDDSKNSHITSQYLTFNKNKFFTSAPSKKYNDLFVLKYKKSVFWNNDFDDALLEMRGTVIDKHHNIIIRPFKKVFNYSEMINENSRYKTDLTKDTLVYGVVKINGFLGNATYVDLSKRTNLVNINGNASFDKQVIYSTTGSLDSSFAEMTKNHLKQYEHVFKNFPNHTFAFEIIDESDPHIIKEKPEDVFIGLIDVETGYQYLESELDDIAKKYNLIRPETTKLMKFSEMLNLLKTVKHEGFMVFDENHQLKCKLKSPFYLVSKFIARNIKNLDSKLENGKSVFDEEYYPLIEHLQDKKVKEMFSSLDEQERINYIQNFINSNF